MKSIAAKENLMLIKQIFKFGIVGGIATMIEWLVFYVCDGILSVQYLLSALIGFSFSVTFNFVFSIKWVFDVKNNQKFLFQKFLILSVVGLVLNELILYFFVDKIQFNTMLSKIVATVIVMIYNFITRKKFIES